MRFPEFRRCEDVAFVCRAIDACGSVYYMKEPMYYYFQRSDSLSNNKTMDESDMLKAFEVLNETLADRYQKELGEKSVPDLLYGGTLMMCKANKSSRDIKAYIKRYEKKYPNWTKSKSLKELGKAKKVFLIAVKFRQVMMMRILSYVHSRLIGQ